MNMGGPQPYAVFPFQERLPVPQLVCARVDGKPNPVPLLPQLRFAADGTQGVSMGDLLRHPKDILRKRISWFEDQRILEVLFTHIELKIYVSLLLLWFFMGALNVTSLLLHSGLGIPTRISPTGCTYPSKVAAG